MKKILLYILLVFINVGICSSQDNTEISGGKIRYEAFNKFDISYFKDADPKVKEWLASMPKGTKSAKVLYFNLNHSLFEEDKTAEGTVVDKKVLVMRSKMPYITPPNPILKKVYIDRGKGKMFKQIELMTRFFIIEDNLMEWDWKPGTKQVTILDYLCMSATANSGDNIITAWFTPQIRTKAGPDLYGELPGLILAIDINGENVLLATEVDLNSPGDEMFTVPSVGKKMKKEAFQKLVDEKINQYRAERESQKKIKNSNKSGYQKKLQ